MLKFAPTIASAIAIAASATAAVAQTPAPTAVASSSSSAHTVVSKKTTTTTTTPALAAPARKPRAKTAASTGRMVTAKLANGKTVTYNCSLKGNATKAACK